MLNYSWLHHPTFGYPFIDESVEIEVPCEKIVVPQSEDIPLDSVLEAGYEGKWPYAKRKDGTFEDLRKYPKKGTQNSVDLVYIPELKEPTYSIYNRNLKVGVRLKWDKEIFPSLWYWRPIGGGARDPWFGTIYATSLEIASSYPASGLDSQVENNTARKIKGNSEIETELTMEVF
ncbi:MAG: DUF4432 family protein [Thermoplasmatales archaeon]